MEKEIAEQEAMLETLKRSMAHYQAIVAENDQLIRDLEALEVRVLRNRGRGKQTAPRSMPLLGALAPLLFVAFSIPSMTLWRR